MTDVDVAIVGAGPTGLALAGELRLAGLTCRVLERRREEPNITRAFAVHARTLELLDARGLAEDLLPRGIQVPSVQPAPGAVLDLTKLASRYPMVLIVPQSGTENLLEQRARELGAVVQRGSEVVGLTQNDQAVQLTLGSGETVTASYVVGTDGAHSKVRDLIGVPFAGKEYETHIMLADVQLTRAPAETLFGTASADGIVLFVPFGDGWFRAIGWDRAREDVPLSEPITHDELRETFQRIAGDDFGMGEPRWQSRFLSERRQAARYRVGRVFLAGDAAHVHSPVGGQGMNTGIGDAMNLGWKLGAVHHGWGPPDLLDTYTGERHPVGEAVLKLTDALFRLVMARSELGIKVRTRVIRTLLHIEPVRREARDRLSGIGIHYGRPSGAHSSVGHRFPDVGDDGRAVYDALRAGKFVLVDRRPGATAQAGDHVVGVTLAAADGEPAVTLVRPDAYIAWAANDPQQSEVDSAVTTWCLGSAKSRFAR